MEPVTSEEPTSTARRRWPTVLLALVVMIGGAVAWVATRPTTTSYCSLAGYLGGPGMPASFASAEEAFDWWWSEGGGAAQASGLVGDRSGRFDPAGGEPVTPATLVPQRDDFERRGEEWVWEYEDGLEVRVQLAEQLGRWTIVGVNQCGVWQR